MTKGAPSQEFVPIKEIRGGLIVLEDGGLRAILLASSINLLLKSFEEQNATIVQFQNFLNTLEFPTQIVIQSRRLDINPYLTRLENVYKEQTEPLLKIQAREYINFIRSLTQSINVMTKKFFVVVSYTPATLSTGGGGLGGLFGKKKTQKADTEEFETKRSQLEKRIGVVERGLSSFGVRSTLLGTEEVIELFYNLFNPGETASIIKEK